MVINIVDKALLTTQREKITPLFYILSSITHKFAATTHKYVFLQG
jgi:hypothetical protein